MYAVSHKLQLHYTQFPLAIDPRDDCTWIFAQQLDKQKSEFFLPLLHQHDSIKLEFEALQTQLTSLITSKEDINTHKDKLITALMLAETLQYHYCHFYGVKREVEHYQQEAQILQNLLKTLGFVFPDDQVALSSNLPDGYISQTIRQQTTKWNVVRQAVQRSRKFILETDHLMNSIKASTWIEKIDQTASPVLNYLVLLFFLPRTACNLWILGKHVLPGSWMAEKELSLGWKNRLKIQLKEMGFELGDDLVWCVVNISVCFILIGPLSHWAMPVIMGQQICEVISRASKLLAEVTPLMNLRNHYLEQLENGALDQQTKAQIESYLTYLDEQIEYEIKLLAFNAFNSTTILILSILTISLFSAYPLIPFISAGLLVAVTGIYYYANESMKQKSPTKPDALANKASQLGLFSQSDNDDIMDDINQFGIISSSR